MSDVIYKRLDFDNSADVKSVALMHEEAPVNWRLNYTVDPKEVDRRIEYLLSKKEDSSFFIDVARDNNDNIIGVHWIETVEKWEKKGGHIGSLCVKEDCRRSGIATELKRRGEIWAKDSCLEFISTDVFYSNKKMIDLNRKLGFKLGQVHMIKDL